MDCRIGATAPNVGHGLRVEGRAMTESSRNRLSVDLRGLKPALLTCAQTLGVSRPLAAGRPQHPGLAKGVEQANEAPLAI